MNINFDVTKVPTPSYVVDERLLAKNLEVLERVQNETGAKILLALKGFSMYHTFPQISQVLAGITSSSLNEALLGREEMDKEVHIYAPAYHPDEIDKIINVVDHMVFNSFDQLDRFKDSLDKVEGKYIERAIRINPQYSEIKTPIYDPCYRGSRLGVTLDQFDASRLDELDGIHFHTMCEQNSDTLERTLEVVEEKFGAYLGKMKWLNFGGGHHITREDYDVDRLIRLINYMKDKYHVQIYLEPGEAIALNTGFLVTQVLDVVENEVKNAIVDTSAACHMPDVIEMPYRPIIIGSGEPDEKAYTYRLGGMTCLAGDIIGDYSFDEALKNGDRLVFTDMAHYTMVKNNTFNGINLPSIVMVNDDGMRVVKTFGYEDYKRRL